MSPTLALYGCIAFCIYVLYRERKSSVSLSPALWLPSLWLIRCASRSIAFWLGGGIDETLESEGSPHDRIFFLALTFLGLIVLSKRKVNWSAWTQRDIWIFVLYVYMGLSILWAESTFIAFKRYFRVVGDLVMVLVIVTDGNPLRALMTVIRRTVLLLIPLSALLAKYFGELGRMHEKHDSPDSWIGVTTHKNCLGQLCAIAVIFLMWNFFNRLWHKDTLDRSHWMDGKWTFLYLGMTAYLLNGGGSSRSTTAVLVSLIAFTLFMAMERYKAKLSKLWWMIAVAGSSYFIVDTIVQYTQDQSLYEFAVTSIGKDPTLTDRTDLWADLYQMGMKNPILGRGYMSFWTDSNLQALIDMGWTWGPEQAHSGYLETFLHLGLVGLLLTVVIILTAIFRAMKLANTEFEYGRIRLIFILLSLMCNMSESCFGRPTNPIWFVFLASAATSPRLRRSKSSSHSSPERFAAATPVTV